MKKLLVITIVTGLFGLAAMPAMADCVTPWGTALTSNHAVNAFPVVLNNGCVGYRLTCQGTALTCSLSGGTPEPMSDCQTPSCGGTECVTNQNHGLSFGVPEGASPSQQMAWMVTVCGVEYPGSNCATIQGYEPAYPNCLVPYVPNTPPCQALNGTCGTFN